MKRVALAAAATTLVLSLIGPAGAGLQPPAFDYSPTSGPVGTVIAASGNCFDVLPPAGGPASADTPAGGPLLSVTVTLWTQDDVVLDTTTEETDPEGNWAVELTVPDGTPPGEYPLEAFCTAVFGETSVPKSGADAPDAPAGLPEEWFYAEQLFTVTAQAPTTTAAPTSTTAATTTTAAVAAQAQRAQPAFTG